MPKRFYKHKVLLDEQVSPRQFFPELNERFDVKHIKHDLNRAGIPDPQVYALAVSQGRVILTKNVKDFRPLLEDNSPGIIGLAETWSLSQVETKLTALLMKHGPAYFRGRYRSLAGEERIQAGKTKKQHRGQGQ
jgi:predicted nuclease of predicted toxin-antitoxin system